MYNHIGIVIWPKLPKGGSSEEFWTMNESLIQQYYMKDDLPTERKLLFIMKIMILIMK